MAINSVGVTGLTPFPYPMTPLNNITPMTYRDGITFASQLEHLRQWVEESVFPEFSEIIQKTYDNFLEGISNAENTIISSELDWQTFFDNFIANVTAEIALLNDSAIKNLVEDPTTQTGEALRTLLNNRITEAVNSVNISLGEAIDSLEEKTTNDITALEEKTTNDITTLEENISNETRIRDIAQWGISGPMYRANAGEKLTIPTHLNANGGQTTHPAVVKFDTPWNGYKYWMGHTPYAGGNDSEEDPNLSASHDGISWVTPSGLVNPLDDAPGSPQYNSDPDLVYALGKLWYFWRYRDSNAGVASENIFVRTSVDGVSWTPKELVYQSNYATRQLVSPSFIFDGTRWTMYAVDVSQTTNIVLRAVSTGASPLIGQWGSAVGCSFPTVTGSDPWHLQVRFVDGVYVALLNTCLSGTNGSGGNLYLRTSTNGFTFKGTSRRIIPQMGESHSALYRASFIPEVIGGVKCLRIWYGAWVRTPAIVWNIYHTIATISADSGPFAEAAGTVPPQTVPAGANIFTYVTFPAGRFTVQPIVNVSLSDGIRDLNVSATVLTTEGFRLNIGSTYGFERVSGARWSAVQMLPNKAGE